MESEEPVHEHLAELFERVSPDCILDVGANTGQYAELLREHGYEGWIVSFEPVRSTFEELAAGAESDPRWRVVHAALGAKAERKRITIATVTELSSFRSFRRYGSREFPGASEQAGSEVVEVRTLNDSYAEFLADIPWDRLFLKLDTQGWDLEVLKGADQLLPRLVGLQLEAAVTPIYARVPTLTETLDYIGALGFGLTGVFPVNRDSLFRLIEADCVFVNPELVDPEDTWAMLEHRFRREVAGAISAGADFALIDDGELGVDEVDGRKAIPFMDYGRPEDGSQAVAELRRESTRYLVLAWPSFWWLEEYPELSDHLDADWRRASETGAAIVFERTRA